MSRTAQLRKVGADSLCVPGIPLRGQVTAQDPALFAKVVTAAFSQRRKMLRNTLRDYISEAALAALGITPTARAEDIAVADYVRLANALADLGRH